MKCIKLFAIAFTMTGAVGAHGAVIGVDAIHGFGTDFYLGTGAHFTQFRATIEALGDTIVPLTSFDAASLSGLDGIILKMPYSQNSANFTTSEIAAIQLFSQREVFTSDSSMWADGPGSQRPLSFGDNKQLLENAVNFISSNGAIFIADAGTGFQVGNFNALVAPYGITYAATPTDSGGRTVTGFVDHPVTAGISTLGIDFQLPMTVTSPAIDLTIGSGQDNILAAVGVPEPGSLGAGMGVLVLLKRRRRGVQRT